MMVKEWFFRKIGGGKFSKQVDKANSQSWCHQTITSKQMLYDWLTYEKQNYDRLSPLSRIMVLSEHDGLWAYQRRLRWTEYYLNCGHIIRYWISFIRLNRLSFKYGMQLRLNSCGRGLRIVHPGTIITNGDLGRDCQLFPGACVVSDGHHKDVPTIGNKVVICTGAVVMGPVEIADGIVVGANAVVNKSVSQSFTTIAGIPAKVVSNRGSDTWAAPNKTWKTEI